ncbi:MAG: amidohydrolase [Nitrososphaerota archaeon]|nr:amidohydrolase [Nitrososphaerota archaeon]MDG6924321.1 amidohydrolase [Nitrososphaerota archaeon]
MPNENMDVHSHVLPSELLREFKADVSQSEELYTLGVYGKKIGPVTRGFFDDVSRRKEVKAMGIDSQAISVTHHLFMYAEKDLKVAKQIARRQNEAITNFCKKSDDMFVGNGTLPLQDTQLALEELDFIHNKLGLRGVEIGTNVAGKNLDSEELFPVFEKLQEYGMPILVHPNDPLASERLKKYYMEIVVGTLLETTVAVSTLILGGVLKRLPRLKFVFCHGGAAVPYQVGRLEKGVKVRKEMKDSGINVDEDFHKLYFDTVLFRNSSLKFLLDTAGPDRVVLGTDYPFNMGEPDTLDNIRKLPVAERIRSEVASNTRRLYGL